MTLAKTSTSGKPAKKDQEGETWNDLHMQNQSCFGGFLIVATLVPMLLIPSTPTQLELINDNFCYLTYQIIIRQVQLTSCHTQ